MKLLSILILAIAFSGAVSDSIQYLSSGMESSIAILEKSRIAHDPSGRWDTFRFSIHIQEPRPQTPLRYSELMLDNQTGAFRLKRIYEPGTIERIITEDEESQILLNGSSDIPAQVREEYRLSEDSNFVYRNFYQTINGLPMSLTEEKWINIEEPEKITFDEQSVYQIRVELAEPMISKYWELMIDSEDYSLVALKFDHSEDGDRPDELILFDGSLSLGGITIPRFRHWYYYDSREYLGSDVIVKSMEESSF